MVFGCDIGSDTGHFRPGSLIPFTGTTWEVYQPIKSVIHVLKLSHLDALASILNSAFTTFNSTHYFHELVCWQVHIGKQDINVTK